MAALLANIYLYIRYFAEIYVALYWLGLQIPICGVPANKY
jgi:hypothetical protein